MSNVRNWASTAVVVSLILLAPIIAFAVVITVEMLGDVMARAGATAIWPVLAVGMAWVLLRKFGGQFRFSWSVSLDCWSIRLSTSGLQ